LILKNSNFNITIRQHPDERHWYAKSSTNFLKLIKSRYNDNRIQFVSCTDKVNSYALLQDAKAVICYSSTFGVEAAMSGKKVCVCSNVYYSNLDFVYKPSSINDIITFLESADIPFVNKELDKAKLTYYLGQKCNWVFTFFTPSQTDFFT